MRRHSTVSSDVTRSRGRRGIRLSRLQGYERALSLAQCVAANPVRSSGQYYPATSLQTLHAAHGEARVSTAPTYSLESFEEDISRGSSPRFGRMKVQMLDARYIDMGKLLRFLRAEFGEDNFEVESEV